MNRLDFAAINAALTPETVVPQWLPKGEKRGNEWVAPNPTRNDKNPGSFTIKISGAGAGVWKDYATGDGGADLISLYAYLFHADDQGAAARELADSHGVRMGDPVQRQQAAENVRNIEEAKPVPVFPVPADAPQVSFKHPNWGEPDAVWTYRDGKGAVLMYVCRFNPPNKRKQICPRSYCKMPDGAHSWAWRGITGDKTRPLYGLDKLAQFPDADVIVVEGEKAADAAQELFGDRAVVVTWLGGVETANNASVRGLSGRRVFLWPDFDSLRERLTKEEAAAGIEPASKPLLPLHEQPAMRAMMQIATKLKGVASETHLIGYQLEQFPHGWDLADAQAEGWTLAQVMEYMGANAGDPWHIATGKKPAPPELPAPANDNDGSAFLPLSAGVNPFGFPHLTDKGQPMNTVENLAYLMGEYGITAKYNMVRKQVEIVMPGKHYTADNRANCTLAELSSICARNRMPKSDLQDYVKIIADDNSYNPVRDWIASKPWDGVSRLRALYDTLQTTGDAAMRDTLVYRWMLSAVAAVFKETGFHSRGVLVLMGPQGSGKTSWLRSLAPAGLNAFLDGAVLDPANKDLVKNAISHWIVELGELDATFRKADIARLKGFVTLPSDKLRLPYDRIESEYPRRTVLAASVNENRYLVDDTGNSRWWTVPVTSCVFNHGLDMQQVWAELQTHYERGVQWWLTAEEESKLTGTNEDFEATDPVEEMILRAFDWQAQQDFMKWRDMTASEVLQAIGYDKPNKAQATHASKVLRKLTGKDPKRTKVGRFFTMPPKTGGRDTIDDDRPF